MNQEYCSCGVCRAYRETKATPPATERAKPAASDLKSSRELATWLYELWHRSEQSIDRTINEAARHIRIDRAKARQEAAAEEREKWMSCARIDVLMEGPRLKGWQTSALNMLWEENQNGGPGQGDQKSP